MATPTSPSPQTARFQEKREAILGAAALLFNERGVKGATLSDIASSVGLVTNSVTYYYRKKEDLATACFLRAIAAFDEIAAAATKEITTHARLTYFFRNYALLLSGMELGQQPPLVFFNDLRALPSPQLDEVFSAYTDLFRRVRGLLKSAETVSLSRDDLNARAHIILSVANWMRAWFWRYEADEYTRISERVVDVLMNGFSGAESSWNATQRELEWTLATGHSETADSFLRAATLLVNEQGYRGASVDKISAKLNVTKGSFYHHNDNKQDLISECFERTFSVVRQALSLAESSTGSGWERACAAARVLVRYQLSENGPLLRSSATSALPDQEHRDRVSRTLTRLTERMASVVVDGMMDNSIRPLDPSVAAQISVGLVNAAAELTRWVPNANPDNGPEIYVRPIFLGILCPASGA